MFESFLVVGRQVVVLFILIALGFLCNKRRLLNAETVAGMTDLVLYVVTPCIIVVSFQRELSRAMLGSLGLAFLVGVIYHLINIALAHTCLSDPYERRQKVLRFSLVFSNAGYMSLPLQRELLGEIGVFYGAAIVAVFNLCLWSYGLILMSGETCEIRLRKVLLNPGVTSVMIGVLLFVSSCQIPSLLLEPMKAVASLNTPIPMIIIGYYLADAKLGRVVRDGRVYAAMGLRLLGVPLILLGLFWVAGIENATLVLACMIAASAPAAAATTMFAAKFHQDTLLSVGIVSYSTLLSLVTMPLVVGFARYLMLR